MPRGASGTPTSAGSSTPTRPTWTATSRTSRPTASCVSVSALFLALGGRSACCVPAVLGGLITVIVDGALPGFVWGGLVRVFLVHHVTWSINSVCHLWGTRPYRSRDESREQRVFGVLGLGEGWHNNHHAFPTSARHGLRWWQFDVSYWVIRTLEWTGLAWKVRVPAAHVLAAKRRGRPVQGSVASTTASD